MKNDRIDDLEIRISHLEDYLKQLNEVVMENGRLLEMLKTDQTGLRRQLNEISDQMPGPESQKPPHY